MKTLFKSIGLFLLLFLISCQCGDCPEFEIQIDINYLNQQGHSIFENEALSPEKDITVYYMQDHHFTQVFNAPSYWVQTKAINDKIIRTQLNTDPSKNGFCRTILQVKGFSPDTIDATFSHKKNLTVLDRLVLNGAEQHRFGKNQMVTIVK